MDALPRPDDLRMSAGGSIGSLGNCLGVVAMLIAGGWLAMMNVAISGLIVSNTLRRIEPVSLLLILAVGCIATYVGLVILATRVLLARERSFRQLPRWVAGRLLIVGFAFVGITVLALAVPG